MFEDMIEDWFAGDAVPYNEFLRALMLGDLDAMNEYMNQVTLETFSSFDTGKRPSGKTEPEQLLPRLCFGADGGFKGQIRDHFQPGERIRKYGFAFDGKTVLIG